MELLRIGGPFVTETVPFQVIDEIGEESNGIPPNGSLRVCECVVMSVYVIKSEKSLLQAQCSSFTEKEKLCTHPKGKITGTIRLNNCHFLERMKFSLVGVGVRVCMSMSVWSEKKKEETKKIHIHSHIHTPIHVEKCGLKGVQ